MGAARHCQRRDEQRHTAAGLRRGGRHGREESTTNVIASSQHSRQSSATVVLHCGHACGTVPAVATLPEQTETYVARALCPARARLPEVVHALSEERFALGALRALCDVRADGETPYARALCDWLDEQPARAFYERAVASGLLPAHWATGSTRVFVSRDATALGTTPSTALALAFVAE